MLISQFNNFRLTFGRLETWTQPTMSGEEELMTNPPTENEEAYFKQQDLERLKRSREETVRRTAVEERERLKKLHWMRCPKCGMELAEVTFRGVVVDACFSCHGMFLDQGEIDKVLTHREPGALQKFISGILGPRTS